GAHSFCRGGTSSSEDTEQFPRRWSNYALPNRYMEEASGHGNASSWSEVLDRKGEMFEFFFLGLRKLQGVRFSEFLERFGEPVEAVYPALLNVLVEHKLLERDDDFLRLSAKGLMVADSVIENFADPEMSVASSEFEAVKVGNG